MNEITIEDIERIESHVEILASVAGGVSVLRWNTIATDLLSFCGLARQALTEDFKQAGDTKGDILKDQSTSPSLKELASGLIELKKQAYPSETVRINASHINRILEALERAANMERALGAIVSRQELYFDGHEGLLGETDKALLGAARQALAGEQR